MKTFLALALAFCSTLAFAGGVDADEQALRDLHANARAAHLKGDADLLAKGVAGEFLDVGRGKFERVKREDFRQRFVKVFATTKYLRWEDVVPPVVHIASDHKSGWMAVQLSATVTSQQNGKPPETAEFQMAWLANYEKQNGRWVMTAISYNVPPGK